MHEGFVMPPVSKPSRERRATFFLQWRKFRKLSQEAAAERIGVDRSTISRIEKGESPYDQDFLEKAAFAFGCDPEDLLTIDPTKRDPLREVWANLEKASPDVKARVLGYLEGLLKAS
jgi:transcriptional regulator with XRE-family HTH domain